MHNVGIVLHPQRDSAEAVDAILGWAEQRSIGVLGIVSEISRLRCAAVGVTPEELGRRSDLIVSLGGDGTMLRAMRLADQQRAPVLGVNLGQLGFLAEIDVPELPDALTAFDAKDYSLEPRLAVDTVLGGKTVTAFNDIVVVRVPGNGNAAAWSCPWRARWRWTRSPKASTLRSRWTSRCQAGWSGATASSSRPGPAPP